MKSSICPAVIFDTVKISLFRKVMVKKLTLGEIEQYLALIQLFQFGKVVKNKALVKEAGGEIMNMVLKKSVKWFNTADVEKVILSVRELNFNTNKKKTTTENTKEKKDDISMLAYYIAYFSLECGWNVAEIKALYPEEIVNIINEIEIKKKIQAASNRYRNKVDIMTATLSYKEPNKVAKGWFHELTKDIENVRNTEINQVKTKEEQKAQVIRNREKMKEGKK